MATECPRLDHREGDQPRGGIDGLEVPKSAAVKGWRVSIATPDNIHVFAPQSFFCRSLVHKNSIAEFGNSWQWRAELHCHEQRDTRHSLGNIPPRILNTTWSSSDLVNALAPEGHGHTCSRLSTSASHKEEAHFRFQKPFRWNFATFKSAVHKGSEQLCLMRSSFEVRPSLSTFPEAKFKYTAATDMVRTQFVDHPAQRTLQAPDHS